MQKNLWLAVGLSMVVYGAWLMYMSKFPTEEQVSVTETAKLPSPSAGTPAATSPAGRGQQGTSPLPAGEDGRRPGEGTPALFDAEAMGRPMKYLSSGGALAGFEFDDVSGPTQLLPLQRSQFFSTWPEVRFQPVKSNAGVFAMEGLHPSGLRLRKEFVWAGRGQIQTLRITASNPTKRPIQLEGWGLSLGPGLGSVSSETDIQKTLRAVASWQEPPRKSPTVKKLKEGVYTQQWNWIGVDNRYFLAAVLADPSVFPTARVEDKKLDDKTDPEITLAPAPQIIEAGASKTWDIRFYLGPKDYVKLMAMGEGLDAAVDFGFFGALGKLTFRALRALYSIVGNYGIAIILLTLFLQFLMLPMTLKSLRTSILMQKLQPKIKEIQAKYADDPRRMNVEMMELYKSSGTNPLGGCLPLLAQLPIFWALFTMLRNCWELHGAPFAFWIHDLSAHDPYHALPLIMGGLMFVQQRLNPAAADPAQQKVFMFMPLMFVFMFWSFPSGLVLYWMVSSLFGLTQQFLFRRYAKL